MRLPKTVLDKYAIRDAVIVEQREDWSDLDGTLHDGLDKEPW